MNWKEHAHLFANGKFKGTFRKRGEDHTGSIRGFRKISGLKPEYQFDIGLGGTYWICIYDCTLIARKIEDMTDEEMSASPLSKSLDGYDKKMFLGACANNSPNRMNSEQMLYLISIGVYPFDQAHFETGEVIDRSTL